jgi:hypothetical protein
VMQRLFEFKMSATNIKPTNGSGCPPLNMEALRKY